MPRLSFSVKTYIENAGFLPELEARSLDLKPAFEAMFKEWTELNAQKFEQSVGREATGAQVFEEFWAPLTPEYMAEKHGEGSAKVTKKMSRGKASFEGAFPDWLMVRTGALRAALTNPDALFSSINAEEAIFGTPNDPALANIVQWQAGERQKNRYVIFLSDPDTRMIKRILQDYLSMGGDFQEKRSQKALAAVGYAPVDALGMEVDFNSGGE